MWVSVHAGFVLYVDSSRRFISFAASREQMTDVTNEETVSLGDLARVDDKCLPVEAIVEFIEVKTAGGVKKRGDNVPLPVPQHLKFHVLACVSRWLSLKKMP